MECLIEESAPAFKSKRLDILAQLVLQDLMLQVKNATFASIPGLLGIGRIKFASLADEKRRNFRCAALPTFKLVF